MASTLWGQHFLKDKKIIKKIVHLAEPKLQIIEIGPGKGAITKELAKKAPVLAIEKDPKFRKDLEKIKNVKVVFGDALEVLEKYILETEYQIFGNLAYSIEKPLIQKIVKLKNPPKKAVFLIQKEVALPFREDKKILFAESVEFYAKCAYRFSVSKNAFYPLPKVDGAVIEIGHFNYPLPYNLKRKEIERSFFRFLKAGFRYRHKKLINNFSRMLKIKKQILEKKFKILNINRNLRPEELNIEKWLDLYYLLRDEISE